MKVVCCIFEIAGSSSPCTQLGMDLTYISKKCCCSHIQRTCKKTLALAVLYLWSLLSVDPPATIVHVQHPKTIKNIKTQKKKTKTEATFGSLPACPKKPSGPGLPECLRQCMRQQLFQGTSMAEGLEAHRRGRWSFKGRHPIIPYYTPFLSICYC